MKDKTIYDLGLHEVFEDGDKVQYTREPGGWVRVEYDIDMGMTSCFIPLNMEFYSPKKCSCGKHFNRYKGFKFCPFCGIEIDYLEEYKK